MIRVNLKSIRHGFQVVPPALGSFDDGQHLFVMDRIVSFGRGHRMGHIGDRSEVAIISFYRKHTADGKFGGIGF